MVVILSEYAENCSLHGLRYIGSRQSTHVERVFWAVAFLASLVSVSYIVTLVWDKWDRTPVIVSFMNTISPIWKIPFPAVTICNDQKVNMSFLMNYNTANSPEQMEDLSYAAILCPYVNDTLNMEQVNSTKLSQFIMEASPTCEATLDTYTWMGETRQACADFIPAITVAGLCFTFNMLPMHQILKPNVTKEVHTGEINGINIILICKPCIDTFDFNSCRDTRFCDLLGLNVSGTSENTTYDWTPDNQFHASAGSDSRPRRVMGGGIMYGLEMGLTQTSEEINRRCSGPYSGFKVSLHSPAEVPRPDKSFFRVGPNTEVVFAVQPKMLTTQTKLAKIDPQKRSCYFSDEKPLQFFRIYTQRNCRLECQTNYTLQECDCVQFYMPHFGNAPYCSKKKETCAMDVRRKIKEAEMTNSAIQFKKNSSRAVIRSCQCLPSCFELTYDGETSTSTQDWSGYYKEIGQTKNGTTQSRVIIFFKYDQFLSIYRSELYGIVDFISNCGGLLSLFLGFGLLSIVEIFYFVTIRPIFGRVPETTEAPPEDQSVPKYAHLPPVGVNKKGVNQWRTVVY